MKVNHSKLTNNMSITKKNNYVTSNSNFLRNQLKSLIFIKLLFGFNRLYLLPIKRYILVLSYVFSIVYTVLLLAYAYYAFDEFNFPFKVIKYGFTSGHIIFSLFSFRKSNLLKYFRFMEIIDEQLGVFYDLNATNSVKRVAYLLASVLFTNFLEYVLLVSVYLCLGRLRGAIPASAIFSVVSNLELIFYSMLLWFIYIRVSFIKATIEELYSIDKIPKNNNFSIYKSHQRVNILHRMYVKLHDCSLLLTSVFSIPILISFVTSGFYSIVLIKILVNFTQKQVTTCQEILIGYVLLRCLKLTFLLFLPCYYSSLTTTEVSAMRSILHDAIRAVPMDKVERRLTKALYHAVKEYGFEYSLGGIVKLNMTLPLSYINLCTTYLIIFIQFSKFID